MAPRASGCFSARACARRGATGEAALLVGCNALSLEGYLSRVRVNSIAPPAGGGAFLPGLKTRASCADFCELASLPDAVPVDCFVCMCEEM